MLPENFNAAIPPGALTPDTESDENNMIDWQALGRVALRRFYVAANLMHIDAGEAPFPLSGYFYSYAGALQALEKHREAIPNAGIMSSVTAFNLADDGERAAYLGHLRAASRAPDVKGLH